MVAMSSTRSDTPAAATILIVEDDDDGRNLLAYAFEAEGFRALPVASAEDALPLLRTGRIDAVVTDYDLPGDTGVALIVRATLEGSLDLEAMPTVICTGYPDVVAPPHVAIVHKPTEPLEVVRRIEEALYESRGRTNGASLVDHRVSGYDFARAMMLAGFRMVGRSRGHVVMERDARAVQVPQCDVLTEDAIASLLQKAGVLPAQFVTLLNRLGSRDTWPEHSEVLGVRAGARSKA